MGTDSRDPWQDYGTSCTSDYLQYRFIDGNITVEIKKDITPDYKKEILFDPKNLILMEK